jgi:lysophospholipase L1-like esterase
LTLKKIVTIIIVVLVVLALAVFGYFYWQYRYYSKDDPAKWEKDINEIEARTNPSIGKRAVIFIGSSSIYKWKSLERDMSPLPALNHGFGGSRIQDATYFVPRLVTKYDPSLVVLYAGDNDIFFRDLFGKKPDTAMRCLEDFKAFTAAVHKDLPAMRIYFVSIKPSPSRMKYWPQMKETNKLIREYCATDERLAYIDVAGSMLSNDGKPIVKYFIEDNLHLSDAGYALWTSLIKPVLVRDYRRN